MNKEKNENSDFIKRAWNSIVKWIQAGDNGFVFLIISIISIIFAAFFIILALYIIFNISTEEYTTEVLVAIIALVGTIFVEIIGLIGILIKSSYDKRTLDLNKQAEKRQELETKIKAIDLLTDSNGNLMPQSQIAGALFTLAELGDIEFAIALLDDLWPIETPKVVNDKDEKRGCVHTRSAVWIIKKALQSGNDHASDVASELLSSHYKRLVDDFAEPDEDTDFYFPDKLHFMWFPAASNYSKSTVLGALIKSLCYKFKNRSEDVHAYYYFMLNKIRTEEEDNIVKKTALKCMKELYYHVSDYKGYAFGEKWNSDNIHESVHKDLKSMETKSYLYKELIEVFKLDKIEKKRIIKEIIQKKS